MFMAHNSLSQVLLFMALSVSEMLYLSFTHPYKCKKDNRLNMFNESITIVVAYMIMTLNGLCHEAI